MAWGAWAGIVGLGVVAAAVFTGYVSWRAAVGLVRPAREVDAAAPSDVGLPFERVDLRATDGTPLAGWWMPARDARGVVLFLHGYGASKAQALEVAPFLHRAGYHVLAYDARAHGESGGDVTTVGLRESADVDVALGWVAGRPEARALPVAFFGWSMGGVTALHAAAGREGVCAVVIDSTFASLRELTSARIHDLTGLPRWPHGWLSLAFASRIAKADVSENEPLRAAAQVRAPLLVIQGSLDDTVEPGDGARLAEAAPRAELWLCDGAPHVGVHALEPEAYEARVLDLLQRGMD